MDVGGWLRGLGLGEYENKFRNNRIDAEVLSQLTADDLRTLACPRSATDGSSSQLSLHWPGQRLQQSLKLHQTSQRRPSVPMSRLSAGRSL